jgi:exodeoxyribonuclease VII small subunit
MNKSRKTPDQPEELKFEQALARLEKIVSEMESAELPLDEALQRYEEGVRLAAFCSSKLEEAQKKIEILAKKADGSKSLQPFDPESQR